MAKQKREDYEATLLFVLILALLFAFASIVPLWEAQLRGLSDSFFTMFSIIFIFSAITILQSIFRWYRATILLAIAWLASMGIGYSSLSGIQLLSPIVGMILMAFFLDEIYSRWPHALKQLIDKNGFSGIRPTQSEKDTNHQEENEVLALERLSNLMDDTANHPLQQDSQLYKEDQQSFKQQ